MSKPIRLSANIINDIIEKFRAELSDYKMSDGKLRISYDVKDTEERRAKVVFKQSAYMKMLTLLMSNEKEIAWHGVVEKLSTNIYLITDILVYPQIVTGTTVETDQDKYQTWLYSNDDEVFNNLKMQGHSHVHMATHPSSVDLTHQEKIIAQLEKDMFYIFMIYNKDLEHTIKIYDFGENVLYEDADVDVYVGNTPEETYTNFLDQSNSMIETHTYVYANKGKGKSKSKTNAYDYSDWRDYYDGFK